MIRGRDEAEVKDQKSEVMSGASFDEEFDHEAHGGFRFLFFINYVKFRFFVVNFLFRHHFVSAQVRQGYEVYRRN